MSQNKSAKQPDSELDLEIKSIVSSTESYFEKKEDIIAMVKKGSDAHIDSLIKVFMDILIMKDGDPIKKYYCLMLLKECMDLK